jgi:mono/diheme cytochrome c family protein
MKKILFILLLSTQVMAQDYDKGKQLFKNNCASCHNMEKKVVGPALKNVVKNQGEDWTKAWIKNNNKLRASGDKHANQIFKEYNGMAMPAYEHLGDEAIVDLTAYLAQYNDKKAEAVANQPAPVATQQVVVQPGGLTLFEKVLLGIIIGILLIAIGILYNALKVMSQAFRKSRATELYLMKKEDLDSKELNREFDDFVEDEVTKRVDLEMRKFKERVKKLTKYTFKK